MEDMNAKAERGTETDDRRAPMFTVETAAVAGKRGGVASGRARRSKRAMREVVEAVLDAKIRDEEVNRRLREAGYLSKNGRATVRLAAAVNLAEMAMNPSPPKTGHIAISAVEALARLESGEIGTPPAALRDPDDDGGGVVFIPEVTEERPGTAPEAVHSRATMEDTP